MHFSLDIETIGKSPGCAIVQIACVAFTTEIHDKFHATISLASNEEMGLRFETETLYFWLKAKEDVRNHVLLNPDAISLHDALVGLGSFIHKYSPTTQALRENHLWVRGVSFDIPILSAAIEACRKKGHGVLRMDRLVFYRNVHEVRTALMLFGIDVLSTPDAEVGLKHSALYDATAQALDVIKMYKEREEWLNKVKFFYARNPTPEMREAMGLQPLTLTQHHQVPIKRVDFDNNSPIGGLMEDNGE